MKPVTFTIDSSELARISQQQGGWVVVLASFLPTNWKYIGPRLRETFNALDEGNATRKQQSADIRELLLIERARAKAEGIAYNIPSPNQQEY